MIKRLVKEEIRSIHKIFGVKSFMRSENNSLHNILGVLEVKEKISQNVFQELQGEEGVVGMCSIVGELILHTISKEIKSPSKPH